MDSSLSILRWWQQLRVYSPAKVYDPLAKAVDKAYGSLVEDFLEKWKKQSAQIFGMLASEQRALQEHGMRLGPKLAAWWSSQQENLWGEMSAYFGRLKALIDHVEAAFPSIARQEILKDAAVGVPTQFPVISQFLGQFERLLKHGRLLIAAFDPTKNDTLARTLIRSWWERCCRALEEFAAAPLNRALNSSIGFGDANLVACNELSPNPESYRAHAANDPQMYWFAFQEQPPERRSPFTRLLRKEVADALPGQPPEFAKGVEEASIVAARNIWAMQARELNAFHAVQARSPWVACKALDLMLQPKALSDFDLSQEWFWQVGITFDDWVTGLLGVKAPDNLRVAATFIKSVYHIVDGKIHPNWLARTSRGETLSSERAEPIARLISFVMQRLAQWEAEQGIEVPATMAPTLPPISVSVHPAKRRRSYWLIIDKRDKDRKPITEVAVDLLDLFNAGEVGRDVPYETVQQLLAASKILSKHLQIGKKVGNRITTVAAPSLIHRITIERHPPRPDRQPKR